MTSARVATGLVAALVAVTVVVGESMASPDRARSGQLSMTFSVLACPRGGVSACSYMPDFTSIVFTSSCGAPTRMNLTGMSVIHARDTTYREQATFAASSGRFTISISGTHVGTKWRGPGHGRWSYAGSPTNCRTRQRGTYSSAWKADRRRATLTVSFHDVPS